VKDPPCLDVDGSSSSDDDDEMVTESPLKINFAVVEGEYSSEDEDEEEDFVCFHCGGDVCEFVEYRNEIDQKADEVRNNPSMTASTKRKKLYQAFTFAKNEILGRFNRIEPPPCVVAGIRAIFPPDVEGVFTGFIAVDANGNNLPAAGPAVANPLPAAGPVVNEHRQEHKDGSDDEASSKTEDPTTTKSKSKEGNDTKSKSKEGRKPPSSSSSSDSSKNLMKSSSDSGSKDLLRTTSEEDDMSSQTEDPAEKQQRKRKRV
jgi:hypothetical protein